MSFAVDHLRGHVFHGTAEGKCFLVLFLKRLLTQPEVCQGNVPVCVQKNAIMEKRTSYFNRAVAFRS